MLSKSIRAFAGLLSAIFLAIPILALASAPGWEVNMTEGVTPVSRDVFGLHMQIFWWCVAIGVVVFGVMFYTMIMHRKSRGVKAANFHDSTALEILWTVVPFIILIIMAIPATSSLKKMYDSSGSEVDILITGYQWYWEYEYLGQEVSFFSYLSTPRAQINNEEEKSPNYLLEVDEPVVIPVGKKVRFLITAADVIHAWWVPELAVKRDAIPGFINESWTYVEEPGIYRGQCAELCGKDHGFMPVVVKAVEQEEYDAWLADRREKAAKIRELAEKTFEFEELYATGEDVYNSKCAACHQVDGQGVPGVFPGIAGSAIATGALDVHLDMIVNGSKTNPAMQAFGDKLSEVDLAAVLTYQRNAFGNNTGDVVQPIQVLNFKQGQ